MPRDCHHWAFRGHSTERNVMRLYDIAAEIRQMFDAGDESGEVSPDTFDQFSKLNLEWDAKVNAICGLIQELFAFVDAAKTESKRLADLAKVRCRRAESLEEYLMLCLDRLGQTRHETDKFKTWIQKNPISFIPTVDAEDLPEKFQRVVVAPDLQAVKKEFEDTGIVPEGFEKKQGRNLRIK